MQFSCSACNHKIAHAYRVACMLLIERQLLKDRAPNTGAGAASQTVGPVILGYAGRASLNLRLVTGLCAPPRENASIDEMEYEQMSCRPEKPLSRQHRIFKGAATTGLRVAQDCSALPER